LQKAMRNLDEREPDPHAAHRVQKARPRARSLGIASAVRCSCWTSSNININPARNDMSSLVLRIAGGVAVCALVACGKKDNAGAAGDSTARGAGNSAAAAPAAGGTTAASANASGGNAGLSDPNIVYILDQANVGDSARGRIAETKGTSADVKNFGKLMVAEHHLVRQQGLQLAKKLNVTPQAPSGDQSEAQNKTELDSLNAMPKGKAWDKAYIDYEVTYHQQLLQTATKAHDAAQNQELKDLIQKAAPIVQKHLDRAKQIQQKLGS
jgi:putative membrane protein